VAHNADADQTSGQKNFYFLVDTKNDLLYKGGLLRKSGVYKIAK